MLFLNGFFLYNFLFTMFSSFSVGARVAKARGDLQDKIINEGIPIPYGNVLQIVWTSKQ